MLSAMRTLTALLLSLLLLPAQAAVYRWVDPTGQVHFSDQPTPGSERIELRESSVYSPAQPPPAQTTGEGPADAAGEPPKPVKYTRIDVVSPEEDEALRSNEGEVSISLELRPGLAPEHKIRLFLDGTPAGEDLPTTQITLQNVDRGTHSLEAAVVDAGGAELLRSDAVTFHLLRAAVGGPRAAPAGG